jgi:hypothetical protein
MHQHAEDRPIAKATYFRVVCANRVPCAIVHSGAVKIPDRIGATWQKSRGRSRSGPVGPSY